MKISKLRTLQYSFVTLFLIQFFSSCTTPRNVLYFESLPNNYQSGVSNVGFELKIQINDLLYIGVASISPETLIYNAPQTSTIPQSTSAGNTNGYLVDNLGNIQFPRLGSIRVVGMTRNELRNKIQNDLKPYLKEPVVTVRFLNQRVTVLGEVNKPQVIPLAAERLPLLEAIGMSGDLTLYGRRDRVLIIRETNTGKIFKRLNISDSSILNSDYYYLQPNDIVYVEPTKLRIRNTNTNPQTISYIISTLSLVAIILDRVFR